MPPRTRKTPLRATTKADAEAAEKAAAEKDAKPKTVTQAADSGTTRELLVAMRNRIAEAVENKNTAARDLAALTKRLVEVVRDIEAIDAREAEDAKEGGGPAPDEAFDASAI